MGARRRMMVGMMAVCAAMSVMPVFGQTAAPMTAQAPSTAPALPPTDQPHAKTRPNGAADGGWMKRHEALVAQAKKGGIDLYFEGDSITDFWTGIHPRGVHPGLDIWNKEFGGWNPGNFGIAADRTENVLWRLQNGELDGVTPKVVVLMIGTNNSSDYTAEEIASGVTAIVKTFRDKAPQAKILVLAIFPRGDVKSDVPTDKKRKANEAANAIIAKLDDGRHVKFLNINDKFPAVDGPEFKGVFPDLLHPNAQGYQAWADAIKPTLTEWLGAPAATAPAP